jgi:hypothetical protein
MRPEGIIEIGDGFHDKFGVSVSSKKLMQSKVTFDYINGRRLLDCEIKDGYILSPNGNKVYNIVIPETGFIHSERVSEYLDLARKKGVNVIFDKKDVSFDGISKDLRVCTENPYITFMHKSFDGYNLYMLMNTSEEEFETDVVIPCSDMDNFCFVNPETLESVDTDVRIDKNAAKINVKFDSLSPVIICRY